MTYRETWSHEYVVVRRDGQEALLAAFCARIARGEGVECRFFGETRRYLFFGDHKYWPMTVCADIDLEAGDYVLNRARLYRDRRDFEVRTGDRGWRGRVARPARDAHGDGTSPRGLARSWLDVLVDPPRHRVPAS